MSAILTVRLTKEEQGILTKRSKRAGMKKATFVRKLIRDEEIAPAIEKARSIKGPVVLEFVVEPEANVWPIVPPGASNSDMMLDRGEE